MHALAGVDLDLQRGAYTAIMGPSGSGKSTLMHMLAGLDRPRAGNVWIDGQEITTLKERALTQLRRDKIGFIFQTFNLLPTLTAQENIVAAADHRRAQGRRRTGSTSSSTPSGWATG